MRIVMKKTRINLPGSSSFINHWILEVAASEEPESRQAHAYKIRSTFANNE